MELQERFSGVLGEDRVLTEEPMKNHTTFRIGGPADFFLKIASSEELRKVLDICREYRKEYFILGNGSNLLVSDLGYRGVVLQIFKDLSLIKVEGTSLYAQAGALLSGIASAAREHSLTGLEFAGGIPGTLGGAVVMNAGAYGGEMKDVLSGATVMTRDGEILHIPKEELKLGYRTSSIKEKDYIVLDASFSLKKGKQEEISARMRELAEKRNEKQPLSFPSAGSTFKRPEGYFAGKLIQDAGLRGYSVGDASVSEKHCGFVINRGQATADEVLTLIRDVQRIVKEKSGVTLEPEVKFLGEFKEGPCAL